MSWYYLQAHNPDAPPYWACHYAVTTHPKYYHCFECPDANTCDLLTERLNLQGDLEGLPAQIEVDESFWTAKECISDGRCLECPYSLHCFQLWVFRQMLRGTFTIENQEDSELSPCLNGDLKCVKCSHIRHCQRLQGYLEALAQLEREGAEMKRWSIVHCRQDGYSKDLCCGCVDALYCPKLREAFDLYSDTPPIEKPPRTFKERLLARLEKFLLSLLPR